MRMEYMEHNKGVFLEQLSWKEAESLLSDSAVIVLPLGAAAKEHGYHLPLNNDLLMANYLAKETARNLDVIVAPSINYSYYPAFVEYPGSVSLSIETASKIVEEICRSLASFGPRRFYALNTGISTRVPLERAAATLQTDGVILHFTDLHKALQAITDEISAQEGGSHADEIETSIMLYIAPDIVRMDLACKDFCKEATGRLSRHQTSKTSYSPSGVWGDATLATKSKGEKIVKCLIDHIAADIEQLRHSQPVISQG
ncbi:MAG: creatininase family protein [Candidatus Obscuribacterales bacterium]|nr:creatininase family protein [Candidatus Obscuribacterales bacterium]